jgi:hypothetical protein
MYLFTFLIFAAAANAVALPLAWLAWVKNRQSCHIIEYILIYLTWGLFVGLVGFVFDGLDDAMVQLKVSTMVITVLFSVAGILAGLSLLPKVLLAGRKLNDVIVTSLTSILVAVVFSKFAVIIFLFTSDPDFNPDAAQLGFFWVSALLASR